MLSRSFSNVKQPKNKLDPIDIAFFRCLWRSFRTDTCKWYSFQRNDKRAMRKCIAWLMSFWAFTVTQNIFGSCDKKRCIFTFQMLHPGHIGTRTSVWTQQITQWRWRFHTARKTLVIKSENFRCSNSSAFLYIALLFNFWTATPNQTKVWVEQKQMITAIF